MMLARVFTHVNPALLLCNVDMCGPTNHALAGAPVAPRARKGELFGDFIVGRAMRLPMADGPIYCQRHGRDGKSRFLGLGF